MKHYLLIFKDMVTDMVRRKTGKYFFIKSIKEKPLRIVIGASGVTPPDWISSDIDYLNLLNENHWLPYFEKNKIEALLAEHVWEHLSDEDATLATKICFKYLKPEGGYLRVAVPDGFSPDKKYIDYVKPGGNGAGAHDHKVLYNYKTLSNIFEKAGFEISLLEYFDEKGIFHQNNWDPKDGQVCRSSENDKRNKDGKLNYTSLIIDAIKNEKN